MREETSDLKDIRLLAATSILFTVFGALLWREALVYSGKTVLTIEGGSAPVALLGKTESATAVGEAVSGKIGVPVRIRIPSIAVDATVEQVALAKDGSMGVPKDPDDAAWYTLGPRPGEKGSATIDGHVDWTHGATAVFADLRDVKPGDLVTVEDDAGTDVSFVVRESRKYDAAADATDIFRSTDGKAHLNIITCDGTWDRSARQYSQRLVVFADRKTE